MKMLVWKNVLNNTGIVAIHSTDENQAIWNILREVEKNEPDSYKWEVFFNQILNTEGFNGDYTRKNFQEIIKRIKKHPEISNIIINYGPE